MDQDEKDEKDQESELNSEIGKYMFENKVSHEVALEAIVAWRIQDTVKKEKENTFSDQAAKEKEGFKKLTEINTPKNKITVFRHSLKNKTIYIYSSCNDFKIIEENT